MGIVEALGQAARGAMRCPSHSICYALDLCTCGRRAIFASVVGCSFRQSERQSCHHQCRGLTTNGSTAIVSIPYAVWFSTAKRCWADPGCNVNKICVAERL